MTITTTTKLKKKLISQAIEVLREAKNHNKESGKKALFEDDSSTVFLQVFLKKIPERNGAQMIKVNLPHSLLKETNEVCLITGDTNKNDRKAETEPDVLLYKALLDKHGVTQVSKIVTLRQLRTDYKSYADKQKLLAAYDVFLADNKIYECLPRVLGKFFYKKRKFPHKINMKCTNLKQQIEKALCIKMFYITGNGNCCCSEVATLDMSNSEIVANVVEMINTVSKEMSGAWDNVMGVYLKTARSQSIPIYVSYGNPNDVILPEVEEEDDIVIDELTTKPNVSVKVHSDGRVELFTSKKSQEACFDEISKVNIEKKIKADSPENIKRSQKSELKEKLNKSAKKKVQRNLDDEVGESVTNISKKSKQEKKDVLDEDINIVVPKKQMNEIIKNKIQKNLDDIDKSGKSIEEKKNLDEDICVADPGKKWNKSAKKKVQRNLDDEVGESVTNVSKKSKKEKKDVLVKDICIVVPKKQMNETSKSKMQKNLDVDKSEESFDVKKKALDEDICIANPGKRSNKSTKHKVQRNLDNEVGESVNNISEMSKKEKKNILNEDICIADSINNIAIKRCDSTKKSKKDKKNVIEDSYGISLMTEDLPEKKRKSAFKRKRELSESGSKEKESFLSFESPKRNTKKRKVDSENLKKRQPFTNARKKILQQKKKNFKA